MAEDGVQGFVSEDMESNSISMVDVLEHEDRLEEDARAVLAGSDAKNCTYVKGYVKRQALYSCLTCIPPETGGVGGVCLACSLSCHEGHSLVELYTKRNFRCDCGNSCYSGRKCNLEPYKIPKNELNVYNHNFCGMYCSCNRPYPDPEDDMPDQMIQCVICEDWFHGKHLGCQIPASDNYGEMICHACTLKHPFILFYVPLNNASDKVEVPIANESGNDFQLKSVCPLTQQAPPVNTPGTLFLAEDWRSTLCRCKDCRTMYGLEKVSFLVDPDDTVQSYEEMGKVLDGNEPNSQYEQGMKALSKLDRVKQVEAIEGYNHMKQQLMDFLKDFAENKKVVREEDIKQFFTKIEAQKKPREEPPHFCH